MVSTECEPFPAATQHVAWRRQRTLFLIQTLRLCSFNTTCLAVPLVGVFHCLKVGFHLLLTLQKFSDEQVHSLKQLQYTLALVFLTAHERNRQIRHSERQKQRDRRRSGRFGVDKLFVCLAKALSYVPIAANFSESNGNISQLRNNLL